MDITTPYRPTLEQQRFFDEVRRHIDRHRDDFREAGQWLGTEYAIEQVDRREREGRPSDPANYQQAHEEMEQRDRAAGLRTKERSPESALFTRLSGCARDILHDQPDVTNYERNERLPLARRIIFVTWLMTDPDTAELKLGFTTLETMPWAGDWSVSLGRSMVRDDIIPRGWMELARPAWYELCQPAPDSRGSGVLPQEGEWFAPMSRAVEADDGGDRDPRPVLKIDIPARTARLRDKACEFKPGANWDDLKKLGQNPGRLKAMQKARISRLRKYLKANGLKAVADAIQCDNGRYSLCTAKFEVDLIEPE